MAKASRHLHTAKLPFDPVEQRFSGGALMIGEPGAAAFRTSSGLRVTCAAQLRLGDMGVSGCVASSCSLWRSHLDLAGDTKNGEYLGSNK